jgi:hypothetical protein
VGDCGDDLEAAIGVSVALTAARERDSIRAP